MFVFINSYDLRKCHTHPARVMKYAFYFHIFTLLEVPVPGTAGATEIVLKDDESARALDLLHADEWKYRFNVDDTQHMKARIRMLRCKKGVPSCRYNKYRCRCQIDIDVKPILVSLSASIPISAYMIMHVYQCALKFVGTDRLYFFFLWNEFGSSQTVTRLNGGERESCSATDFFLFLF